jgi:hypothetical protein
MKTEVVSVKDGVAKVKTSMKIGDGDWMTPSEQEHKRPKAETGDMPKGYKEVGKGEEKIGDWECEWIEYEMNGQKGKTWISKKYGCIVKSEYDGMVGMELTELHPK